MNTINRTLAGQLLRGLHLIFNQQATATPADEEAVQEVGVQLANPISHGQQRQLLHLGDITGTEVATAWATTGLRVTLRAPQVNPAFLQEQEVTS
jgi:hypothetical protein